MEINKVGNAISFLRKKIGYTQKELADRLGVSDKAVSKWERGLGLPDTAIIGKIAILLDSDTDSLLAGDLANHNTGWKGLLIVESSVHGVNPGTIIYDKPLVYFQISQFLLMGIREISVVGSESECEIIQGLLNGGEGLGIQIEYYRNVPMDELASSSGNVMVVTGRSIIYGVDQTRFFQKAMLNRDKITMLSLPKKVVDSPNCLYFDLDRKIISSESGEKIHTQYDYYQIPIIFCPTEVLGDIDFSRIHQDGLLYISKNKHEIYTVALDRGFVEISINDWDDVADASEFVKIVQKACGMQIYCLEEIAWRRGMISRVQLAQCGEINKDRAYGKYILDIVGRSK